MKRNKLDINKIKERNATEKEIKENEKEVKIKKVFLYIIPILLIIICIIFYVVTNKIIFLIGFGIMLLIALFGWDGNSRICPNCHKWNSLMWIDDKTVLRTTTTVRKGLFGKDKVEENKSYVSKKNAKCINCGKESKCEKQKFKLF